MNLPLLPTTIIGSMPKPGWLTSEWFSITENWRLEGKELEEAFDAIPPVPDWNVPPGCFDVQHLAREYLASKS